LSIGLFDFSYILTKGGVYLKTIERIFMIMEEKKIKDKPIYTAAQVPKSTFSTWRNTLKNPDPDTLPDIANALGVSLEYLITGMEHIEPGTVLPENEQQLLNYYHAANSDGQNQILKHAKYIAAEYPKALGKSSEYKIG